MAFYSHNHVLPQAESGVGLSFGGDGGSGFRPSFAEDLGAGFKGDLGGGFGGNLGGGFGGNLGGGFGGGPSSGFSFSSSAGFRGAESSSFGFRSGSEKETMQNLNDRLAAYLEKVRALEAANTELEIKIRGWYDKQVSIGAGSAAKDYRKYYDTINDLRSKLLAARIKNSKIVLESDNARLAADDFRVKYETELALYQSVQSDINGFRKILDDLTLSRGDFETQFESLNEELAYLKKNHEKEAHVARSSTAGTVNVEMDAVPGVDLTKILNDMRGNYEALAAKNRRDAEALFAQKSNELKKEISVGVEQVQTSKSEISDLRRSFQGLETELQSLLTMKKSYEDNLAETKSRYGAQLQKLQLVISGTEEQLKQIRSDTEHQSLEYRELFDIKTRLELEIETYRHLLEGELDQSSSQSLSTATKSKVIVCKVTESTTESTSEVSSSSKSQTSSVELVKDPTKIVKVKTFEEEVIDGQVVSSRVEEVEQTVN
ncbi:keratin, type I cytoskeletal 47 kDa-like [Rana temporaria]|uniref:keratin, type I cytoskeletal 47 kDa-like n=1 Tax=Rana temporaria TaxID=8407 RepID=UPI001AAD9C65|nr:keratin, type I cytoskeletal 47 kDa-like [Rana temporaria]